MEIITVIALKRKNSSKNQTNNFNQVSIEEYLEKLTVSHLLVEKKVLFVLGRSEQFLQIHTS